MKNEGNKGTIEEDGFHIYAYRTAYSPKDDVTVPPGFEEFKLLEGETLGFLHKMGVNQPLKKQQTILNVKLNDQDFRLLVDTGADLSVLHPDAAKALALPIETTAKNFDMSVQLQ